MNKKALSLAICVALALPTAANALSLGDIESNSSLNQPFKGKINLLSTSVAEAKTLRIRVAPASVFNRVGIDRPAFLNSIRFRTTIQNGRPVILVSSNQPINEPFLNFLLEVSWPNGQLLKEYTVLLDPPVLIRPDTAIASNAAGVRAEPRAQGRITRPVVQQQRRVAQQPRRVVRAAPARTVPARKTASANRAAPRAQVTNYRVRKGDNLSKVARKLSYSGIQKDQMMMALFEKNRKAFSKRNINNLKAGALLTRPTLQEVRAIGSRKAKSMVLAQAREWKKSRAEQVASKASTNTKNTVTTTPKQARLEVMGSKDAITADSTQGSAGNNSEAVSELNKQLSLVNESLTTRLKENEELKSRVSELESLLRKKNRLITLKSEQLAQLQETMSGDASALTNQTVEPVVTESVNGISETAGISGIAEIPTPVVDEGIDLQQQLTNTLSNEEGQIIREEPPQIAVVEAEPTAVSQVEEPQIEAPKVESPFVSETVDKSFDIMGLASSPAAMAGGLGLVGLLGGLWYMRRRKSSNDDEYEEFSSIEIDNEMEDPLFEESSLESDEVDFDEPIFTEGEETEHAFKETDTTLMDANEQDDILQEADVYIVYGLHDQAESELKRAIEKDPLNFAFRAKLLENYKAAGDKESFEKEAKSYMQIDGEGKEVFLADISEWGKSLLPDNKLFDGNSAAAVATGVAMVAGNALASEDEEEVEDVVSDVSEAVNFESSSEENEDEFIDDLASSLDFDDDALESFNIDEVLSETEEDQETDELDVFDEFEIDLDQNDTVKVELSDSFELDIDEGSLDELEVNIEGLDSFIEDSDSDITPDGTSLDLTGINLDFDSEEIEESSASDNTIVLESVEDDELNFEFDTEDESDSIDFESSLDNDLEIANLNLDLDSEQVKKILPEDSEYTSSSKEDSKVSYEDNLLAEFDDNLSFLDLDGDDDVIEETQIETRLDLAKAYIDMGDIEGARSTLEEVIQEGNDDQKREAEELLHQTG